MSFTMIVCISDRLIRMLSPFSSSINVSPSNAATWPPFTKSIRTESSGARTMLLAFYAWEQMGVSTIILAPGAITGPPADKL